MSSKTQPGKEDFIPVHSKDESPRPKSHWKKLLLVAFVTIASYHFYQSLTRPASSLRASDYERDPTKFEKLFLSIPNGHEAIEASRAYANHPHLAGSKEDYEDAKTILALFQKQFGIDPPAEEPIFKAGTPESRNATLNLSSRSSGSKPTAWVDVYYPFMNTPLDRAVEILDNGLPVWEANLVEEVDPLDPDAHKYQDAVPTWHGLSHNGSAVGHLIYANYGTYEDYQSLKEAGVDFTNKIVIVRYGGNFRGLKVKRAEELGASAVLIYSDPRDDGLVTVENGYAPYPEGPARAPASVQRGSVQYLSIYPGDPTTPDFPSYENATRLEAHNIPNIPSLPISWRNAERLLEEIRDIYHSPDAHGHKALTGKASERKIKVVNHVDDRVIPIYNTLAAIPGHIRSEVVIIGAHRDAWVLGAADPISGTVSLHEVIRGFGALLESGWKPLRTVIFASWDAEEAGLIGSTEYSEDFAAWLKQHAVSYLNVDVTAGGSRWAAGASPSLAHLIHTTALDVPHPTDEGRTLWDARLDRGPFTDLKEGFTPELEVIAAKANEDELGKQVRPLGSGSDYSSFLQHLGIASADQGFNAASGDAVYHYHSIYDTQRWQEIYADPPAPNGDVFPRHVAVAKHLGLLALRIIDGITLPLNTTYYALELEDYLSQVKNVAKGLVDFESLDFSRLEASISDLQAASSALDAEKTEAEEKFKDLLDKLPTIRHRHPEHGLFAKLRRFIRRAGRHFRQGQHMCLHKILPRAWEDLLDAETLEEFSSRLTSLPEHFLRDTPLEEFIKAAKRVSKANNKLATFEQGFISKEGIKDRPWYKHLGVAPGKWLGYGATTFPAIIESIAIDQNKTLAIEEIDRLSELLEALAERTHP